MKLPWLLLASLLAAGQAHKEAHPVDVEHYRIAIRLDDRTRSFQAETTITWKSLADTLAECELDAETFKVRRVRDAEGPLSFRQTPGKLSVSLRRPLARGQRHSLIVSYEAKNPRIDPEKYGMPKGYDLGLVFKRQTRDHPALARTLSFPEGARHWFPSHDHPEDKAAADVIVTVRSHWQALSNGRLVSATPAGAWRTYHWSQEQPHSTYLFVLVAGPYVRVSDPEPGLPVGYWVYPGQENVAERTFGRTRSIIRFFEQEYGVPYPWAKYDQVVNPDFGGGMEATTATVIGDRVLRSGPGEDPSSHDWLVAHEAAHQWWGNLITTRNWSHAWLNESFATFGEYLYSANALGEEAGALNLMRKRSRYLEEARSRFLRPLVWNQWQWPNENFNRHTYEKGAAVLHMLRWILGEQQFRQAMTHFLHLHAFKPVETADLQASIRAVTGDSMDRFFAQWVYGPGHPVFEVRWQWLEESRKVQLLVAQTQTPLFETPVDIGVVTEAGKKVERLQIAAAAEQVFEIACDARPRMVKFDHGGHLLMELKFDKTVEELLYQLQHDDAVAVAHMARAVRQLAHHLHQLRNLLVVALYRLNQLRNQRIVPLHRLDKLGNQRIVPLHSARQLRDLLAVAGIRLNKLLHQRQQAFRQLQQLAA